MMNPGPVEEAGRTAQSFIEVMRSQPLALALIVSNFALLGYMFYSGHELIAQRSETARLVSEMVKHTDELLSQCVPVKGMEDLIKMLREKSLLEADKTTGAREPQ